MRNIFNLMTVYVATMLISFAALAEPEDYAYQGKVEGMVCAFCAYNVSNKIRELPGVDKNSVNVELKNGKVEFVSNKKINEKQIAKLFDEAGFKLATLNQINKEALAKVEYSRLAQISVRFPISELGSMDDVLDKLGDLSEAQMSLVKVSAPKAIEMDLLTPLIAGRKQTIKVKYITNDNQGIAIEVYPIAATANK